MVFLFCKKIQCCREIDMEVKETDTLTLPVLKRAIKILRSHRAINQESDLTPEQWKKLRQSFELFMEKNEELEKAGAFEERLT